MPLSLRRRQFALSALIFLPGICISSWITRTPDIRDLLGASTAEMGLVLFGLSLGSMAGILCSGALVARFGARPVVVVGSAFIAVSMLVIGAGAAAQNSFLVALGLSIFGAGMGGGEVAINVEGAAVEQLRGRSFLPLLHGFFSLGTVIGAVAGIVFTAVSFPVLAHLAIVAAIGTVLLLLSATGIAPGTGRRPAVKKSGGGAAKVRVWRDPALLVIAVVMLAMAFAEGTANDWLPLIMVDGHGMDPALGSAAYAAFAVAMTIGRFIGGRLVDRFGNGRVLFVSAVFGLAGLAVVAFVDNAVAAGVAVILWGLGACLGFPVTVSAAGESGANSAARVSFVATIGYVAFLVGPPLLGLIGEHASLRIALLAPMAVLVAAIVLIPRIVRDSEKKAKTFGLPARKSG